MLRVSVVVLAMVVLPLTRVGTTWGQGSPFPPGVDSIPAFKWRIVPMYTGQIRGDVSSVQMINGFQTTAVSITGWTATGSINVDQSDYRLQNRITENKTIIGTVFKDLRPGVSFNSAVNSLRNFSRAVLVSGAVQDFFVNNNSLNGTLNLKSTNESGIRWNGRAGAQGQDSDRTFKRDQTIRGETAAGAGYTFGDRFLAVRARGFFAKSDETSSSATQTFENLGMREDSLSANAVLHFTDSLSVSANFSIFNSTRDFSDQPRGATGGTNLQNALIEEQELKESRVLGFILNTQPIRRLTLKVNTRHSEQLTDYRVDQTRFNRRIVDVIGGDVAYQLGRRTRVASKLERTETLFDLGPKSVSSRHERLQKADITITHSFTPTFTLNVNMNAALRQSFYVEFETNPRDRDQLDQKVNVRLSSQPFPKIQTSLILSVASTDYVNIDRTYSGTNRVETIYDFRPQITYTLNNRVSIRQSYGLAIEFTDFDFDESGNFLDRNITFTNTVAARVTNRLSTRFYYAFHFHDRGAYLPQVPGGERFLDIQREDRRDQISTSVRYELFRHIDLVVKHGYTERSDVTISSGSKRSTTEGGIEVGAEGQWNFGAERNITFSLKKVERFGPFNTEAQNEFWVMNTQVRFAF